MTDKGKGNLCLLCQKQTGSKNISVCEECILDNNIFESLVIFKKLYSQENNRVSKSKWEQRAMSDDVEEMDEEEEELELKDELELRDFDDEKD